MKVFNKHKQLKKEYGDTIIKNIPGVPSSAIMELFMLSSMYFLLTERENKESAYNFIIGLFKEIGPVVHELLYNVKDLKKCEGDIYTNFCKLNRLIFENSDAKGFYSVEEIRDSQELQYIRLTKCLNIDLFSVLGCPELGRVGCDIDIAGYAPEVMGNKVNLDFRRPHTLVNGDEACEFYYYRKRHAPPDMITL